MFEKEWNRGLVNEIMKFLLHFSEDELGVRGHKMVLSTTAEP